MLNAILNLLLAVALGSPLVRWCSVVAGLGAVDAVPGIGWSVVEALSVVAVEVAVVEVVAVGPVPSMLRRDGGVGGCRGDGVVRFDASFVATRLRFFDADPRACHLEDRGVVDEAIDPGS